MLSGKQEAKMSERAIGFVDTWVSEHVNAEGYAPEGDNSRARTLARECLMAAQAAGIPEAEITESIEDLASYMAGEIEDANDREADRLAEKDD
jgi:hypothetical protein